MFVQYNYIIGNGDGNLEKTANSIIDSLSKLSIDEKIMVLEKSFNEILKRDIENNEMVP